MKSGVFEGNKLKSYGDVGTSRGDVGSNKHGVGRQQAGATARLTNTGRGAAGQSAASAPSLGSGSRPRAGAVSRGVGNLSPRTGSVKPGREMKIGLKGDIYETGRAGR